MINWQLRQVSDNQWDLVDNMPSHKPLHCSEPAAGAVAVCLPLWSHRPCCFTVSPNACSCAYAVDFSCLSEWASLGLRKGKQVSAHHLASELSGVVHPTTVRRSGCQECALQHHSLLWKRLFAVSCPWQTDALLQMTWFAILVLLLVPSLSNNWPKPSSAPRTYCPHCRVEAAVCQLATERPSHLWCECLGWIWSWNCIWLTYTAFCNLSSTELACSMSL